MTGSVLAGGKSLRMGTNKALLSIHGKTFVERLCGLLAPLTDPLHIIARQANLYRFLNLPVFEDAVEESGALAGIYTSLLVSPSQTCLIVACDLIFLKEDFIRAVVDASTGYDVTVPVTEGGLEPLCAVYAKTCLEPFAKNLAQRRLKITSSFDGLRVNEISPATIARFDPAGRMFWNINTPSDYDRARRALEAP